MTVKRIHCNMKWSEEDRARHKAIRERFQKERPSPQQLIDSGEYYPSIPAHVYFELKLAQHELKKGREASGLSLADDASVSGIDKAALSRLENGLTENPTVATLARYAAAIGKRLVWTLEDAKAS